MRDIGKNLAVWGFAAQALVALALGIMLLISGQPLVDAETGELVDGGLATAASVLSTISSLGFLAATAGFFGKYMSGRDKVDIFIGALMLASVLSVIFMSGSDMIQVLAGWVYLAVMMFTALKRKKWLLTALTAAALALQLTGGSIAGVLPNTVRVQGMFSGAVSAYCCASVAVYAWKM